MSSEPQQHAFTISIVNKFLRSNLSIVLILLSLVVGAAALLITPREEEPQISVPMVDVYVPFRGGPRPKSSNWWPCRWKNCSTRSTASSMYTRCRSRASRS